MQASFLLDRHFIMGLNATLQTLTLNIMLTLFSEVLVGEQAIGEVASPQVPLHLHSSK